MPEPNASFSPDLGNRPDQDAPSLSEGTRVGKYVIKGLLGKGGMGVVYEATDTDLDRSVALKVLPRSCTEDKIALKRFKREARAAARINHPNAVTVYDSGQIDQTFFIAMELVRGQSGSEFLKQQKNIGSREATRLVADACRALVIVHDAGLIHRDIKPGNILRAADGTVKLSDFGLARTTSSDSGTITHQDAVVGTPKYMSPEQCLNETADKRSDVYGLGATYYAFLTGRAPYKVHSVAELLEAHCNSPVPNPQQFSGGLSDICARITQKAMAKNPDDRYQSAGKMLADLKLALVELIEREKPVADAEMDTVAIDLATQTVPANRTPRSSKVFFTIGCLVVLVLSLVLWAVYPSADQSDQQVTDPSGRAGMSAGDGQASSQQASASRPIPVDTNPEDREAGAIQGMLTNWHPGYGKDQATLLLETFKGFAVAARDTNDPEAMKRAIIRLMEYHVYYSRSPVDEHVELAGEALRLAEQFQPGASNLKGNVVHFPVWSAYIVLPPDGADRFPPSD